jgi:3-oxoadipate enol-lactonase
MPFLDRNGSNLYYESHGTGEPLVFAHGRGGNHLSWWQQIPVFASTFRCITFDHRSFGYSVDSDSPGGQGAFVDDLAALLDHLTIDRAHLVAQSMGGRTCLGYALKHPQRVLSLTLAGTTAGVVDSEIQQLLQAVGPAPEDLLKRVLSKGFRQRQPVLTFLYEQIEALNHVRNRPTRLVNKGPARDDVTRCMVPTQFIVGDEDPLAPEPAVRLLSKWMPKTRMWVIQDCGHSSYFEKPDEFNRLLREFLDSVKRERPQ